MADNQPDCRICNNQLNDPETTGCGHVFCHVCIQHWMSSGKELCPVCNTPLVQSQSNKNIFINQPLTVDNDLQMAKDLVSRKPQFSSDKEHDDIDDTVDTVKSIKNEITLILGLEDNKNKDQIVNDLLENGRQSLNKYQDDIIPHIYTDAMDDNHSKLKMLLKKYFQQQWEIQYGKSNEWFISFLKQYQKGENPDLYEAVLTRTAEYGNKYMKNCPILSIVLQLLFEVIDDNSLQETNIFDDLWLTVTHRGLKSITTYSEYIIPDVLEQQLNKNELELFKALREYYREPLFLLLEQNRIAKGQNLYDVALDNVAEHGWLIGIKEVQNKVAPKSYSALVESLPATPPLKPKEGPKIAAPDTQNDNSTLDQTQSKSNPIETTTTSNGMQDRFYLFTAAGIGVTAALGFGGAYLVERAATEAAERAAEAAARTATEATTRAAVEAAARATAEAACTAAEAAARAAAEAARAAAEAAANATWTGVGLGAAAATVGSVLGPAIAGIFGG